MQFPFRLPNELLLSVPPLSEAVQRVLEGVKVEECNEAMVDLSDYCPTVHFRDRRRPYLSRRTVAEKLHQAQAWLDLQKPGYQLEVIESYRSPRYAKAVERMVRAEALLWIKSHLASGLITEYSPFSSGGTVAVRVLDGHGKPLPVFSPALSPNPWKWIDTPPARRHREILSSAMRAAGFANALPTWWHWSFGDRLWSSATGTLPAFFGEVERVKRIPIRIDGYSR